MIYHENGTKLTENSYAEIGEIMRFVLTIPKGVFTEGASLSGAELRGCYMTTSMNFSANFIFGFDVNMWKTGGWYSMSSQWNRSGMVGPPLPSFLEIVTPQCSNSSDSSNYYATLSVRFNSSAPRGLYSLEMGVRDTDYAWIGSYGYVSGRDFQGIAVGMPPTQAWRVSYGGSYTLQKLDTEGDTLYSVSRNKDFVMRFNISGRVPKYAALRFALPSFIDAVVNVTGWYTEPTSTLGGWVYDQNLETYVWNASEPVKYMNQVYGPHTERRSIPTGTSELINITRLEYSNESFPILVNDSVWVCKQMSFVYNQTSGLFETYYSYTYYGYRYPVYIPETWNEEITVNEPIPSELPVLFELNSSLCSAINHGKEFTVSFVGHFTPLMPTANSGMAFMFEDIVVGPDNDRYQPATYGDAARQTQSEYQMAKQIAIETPVTIAKILDKDGKEPTGWMFQVGKGQSFMVQGRLQGGGVVSDDIDGVWFTMAAHDSSWTAEESVFSDVFYEISYDMTGIPTFRAFNWTQKENYTYGSYWDWTYTSLTGWHYEYNANSSSWEWVYGEYWEWRWAETEGWHWERWFMNQLTGIWQLDWIEPMSAETAISSAFCVTSDFTAYTKEGDLYASFLVNMSASVPDTEYWWNFAFMNNTWFEDYSGGWGEHAVLSWEHEWVYSFDYSSQKLYFNVVDPNQLAFYNNTLCSIQGTDYLVGKELPYIVIDGQVLPVKVHSSYDPMSGKTFNYIFMSDYYNRTEDREYYYYELVNGTRISVTSTPVVSIYNVTTTTADSFLTAMDSAGWWEYGGAVYYYWIDIYGGIHQGPPEIYQYPSIQPVDRVAIDPENVIWYVRYGLSDYLNISNYWWESIDSCYYMTDIDGNLYRMNYDEFFGVYQARIGGTLYNVSWPTQYYTGQYAGSSAFLATHWYSYFWYASIAGDVYEMPYVGAEAGCWYDLAKTQSDGGRVPTTKSVVFNDVVYPTYTFDEYTYYTDIFGTNYSLHVYHRPYWMANDTGIWDPYIAGQSSDVGYFDNNLQFIGVDRIDFVGGPPEWDPFNETYRFHLLNGTVWTAVDSYAMLVFQYDLGGSTFYSTMSWPQSYSDGNYTYYYYTAINGTCIYVPTWEGLPVISSYAVYTRPQAGSKVFDFMNQTYSVYSYGSYCVGCKVLDATYSGDLFINTQMGSRCVFQFNYRSTLVTARAEFESIRKVRVVWGYPVIHGPRPIMSAVYRNFQTFIVGIPERGMWGIKNWAINPDNGALDLDGDLETIDDQYYILRLYNSTNTYSHEWNFMSVSLVWDPNATVYGDEMNIQSWLGINTYTWSCQWSQTFYWHHASDSSKLNSAEMQQVKETLLTTEGQARPGYWDIAWMAQNVTWADIVAEAEARGWDWIKSNQQSWTWLSFGVSQNYGTSHVTGDVDHWLHIGMHYEFSGLMVWNDTNSNGLMEVNIVNPSESELSHYLIPDSVDSVSFVTPGMAYNNTQTRGSINRELTDEITWGVTFRGINGTVFPFTVNGYWGWYDKSVTGADLRTFDERPSKVRLDELSFLAHFNGYVNSTSLNSYAVLKVDNYVGNWDMDIVGGRSNLEGRSLALNYFAEVTMADFAFKANGTAASSEMTVSSETFDFETQGARFAQMIMGGTTYDWSKNTTAPYDVLSYTTPAGAFRTAYESDSGKCAAAWSFSSTMFYVTIGFPEWDGYSVYQDPVFVSYVSNHGTTSGPGGVNFGSPSMMPTVPSSSDSVTIGVDVYATESITSVELMYRTGFSWQTVGMSATGPNHYVGIIPPYGDSVQVYYKIVVHTASGLTESVVFSYIVGKGAVTTTPSTTNTGGLGEGIDMILLVVGGVAAVAVVLVLVIRRKH